MLVLVLVAIRKKMMSAHLTNRMESTLSPSASISIIKRQMGRRRAWLGGKVAHSKSSKYLFTFQAEAMMRVVWLLLLLNEYRMLEVSGRDKAEMRKEGKEARESNREPGQHDRKRCKTDCGHFSTAVDNNCDQTETISLSFTPSTNTESRKKTFCCTVWPASLISN